MKYIKSILEFAKLRNIFITNDTELLKKCNPKFNNDTRLIFDVYLKKFNKNIFLKWNDTKYHNMIDRISNRTSFCSISEFNDFIIFAFNELFNSHFDEITKTGRYALFFPYNTFYIIIDIDYDNLFSKYTQFFISTITNSSPNNLTIIEINDENF